MKRSILLLIIMIIIISSKSCEYIVKASVEPIETCETINVSSKIYLEITDLKISSNLDAVCEFAEILSINAIPFIVVLDVSGENIEETKIDEYINTLIYLNSKGGTVCIGSIYKEDKETYEYIKKELKKNGIKIKKMPSNMYHMSIDELEKLELDKKPFSSFDVDIVLEYEVPSNTYMMIEVVEEINEKWLEIRDVGEDVVEYSIDYSELNYKNNDEFQSVEYREFFRVGNDILVTIVSVSLVVLSVGIYIGYKLYQNKFYR